jgi:excisionase family DNA binding protein
MARPQRLTSAEIQIAFDDEAMRTAFPPILSPELLAQLLGLSVSTIYLWIAKGKLAGAVTKVGKHRLIWRNRAIETLFTRGISKNPQASIKSFGGYTNDNKSDVE